MLLVWIISVIAFAALITIVLYFARKGSGGGGGGSPPTGGGGSVEQDVGISVVFCNHDNDRTVCPASFPSSLHLSKVGSAITLTHTPIAIALDNIDTIQIKSVSGSLNVIPAVFRPKSNLTFAAPMNVGGDVNPVTLAITAMGTITFVPVSDYFPNGGIIPNIQMNWSV